jgi:RHS repeat-associated protein
VLGYGPAASNNGNVTSQAIAGAGDTFSQSYSYDAFNRLKMAQETGGWLQTYVYDAWGNRALVSGTQYYIPGGTWTPQVTADNPSLVPPLFPNNRWIGAVYDGGTPSVGNVTGLPGYTSSYDAENRQVSSTMSGTTTTYAYDGEGRRVMKVAGGATTIFVYDATGQLAAEYATQAPPADCTTCYLTVDHLGSTRLLTDGTTGQPVKRYDYLPFGEEIPAGIGARTTQMGYLLPVSDRFNPKFTGKERDTETSLDYFGARYFSGAMGRFSSSDPGPYIATDPQTWNRYAYTRNSPLKYIDPTGKYFVISSDNEALRRNLSMMLRSSSGRAMAYSVAGDSRPTFVSTQRLPITHHADGSIGITNGTTTPIPGTIGKLGGTDVVVDPVNSAFSALLTKGNIGQSFLKAFLHELSHVSDANAARSFQGAAAAGAAGDAPARPGGTDTTGGTAESRAVNVINELGSTANQYSPDARADAEAAAMIEAGQQQYQQDLQRQINNAIAHRGCTFSKGEQHCD